MSANVIDRVCEVCGRQTTVTVLKKYTSELWPLVQCGSCKFVFLEKAPNYTALVSDEAWEKNHATEAARRKKITMYKFDYATRFRLRIGKWFEEARLQRLIGSNGRALDIGCGGAVRLPKGLTPFGIEISQGLQKLSDATARLHGGSVFLGSALEGLDNFEDDYFDSILMRSYLEHEVNPRAVLEKCFLRLKSGGVVYIKVPDYDCVGRLVVGKHWCGFRFPDHVNYFTKASLTKLSESIGFTYQQANLIAGLDDNLYALLRKPSATATSA